MNYYRSRTKALKGFIRGQYLNRRPIAPRRMRKMTYAVFVMAYAEAWVERGMRCR